MSRVETPNSLLIADEAALLAKQARLVFLGNNGASDIETEQEIIDKNNAELKKAEITQTLKALDEIDAAKLYKSTVDAYINQLEKLENAVRAELSKEVSSLHDKSDEPISQLIEDIRDSEKKLAKLRAEHEKKKAKGDILSGTDFENVFDGQSLVNITSYRKKLFDTLGVIENQDASFSQVSEYLRNRPLGTSTSTEYTKQQLGSRFEALTASKKNNDGKEVFPIAKQQALVSRAIFEQMSAKMNLEKRSQAASLIKEYALQLQDHTKTLETHREEPLDTLFPARTLQQFPQTELNNARKALEQIRQDRAFGLIIDKLESYENNLRDSYANVRAFEMMQQSSTATYEARKANVIRKTAALVADNKAPSFLGRFNLGMGKLFAVSARAVGALDSRIKTPLLSSAFSRAAGFFFRKAQEVGARVGNRELVTSAVSASFENQSSNLKRISRSFAGLKGFLVPKLIANPVNKNSSLSVEDAQKALSSRINERKEKIARQKEGLSARVADLIKTASSGKVGLDEIAPISKNPKLADAGTRNLLIKNDERFFLRINTAKDGRVTDIGLYEKLEGKKTREVDLFDMSGNAVPESLEIFNFLLEKHETVIAKKIEEKRLEEQRVTAAEAVAQAAAREAFATTSLAVSMVEKFAAELPEDMLDDMEVSLEEVTIGGKKYSLEFDPKKPKDFAFLENGLKLDVSTQANLARLEAYLSKSRTTIDEAGKKAAIEVVNASNRGVTKKALFTKLSDIVNEAKTLGVDTEMLKDSKRKDLKSYQKFLKDAPESSHYVRLEFNDDGSIKDAKLFKKRSIRKAVEVPFTDELGNLSPEFEKIFATAKTIFDSRREELARGRDGEVDMDGKSAAIALDRDSSSSTLSGASSEDFDAAEGLVETTSKREKITTKTSLMETLQPLLDSLSRTSETRVEPIRGGKQKITLPAIPPSPKEGKSEVHPYYFVLEAKDGALLDIKLHGGNSVSSFRFGKDHERDLAEKNGDIKDKHEDTIPSLVDAYAALASRTISSERPNPSFSTKGAKGRVAEILQPITGKTTSA